MPYFDFNATAPLHPRARETWLDVSDRAWHNASGLHAPATVAREILDDARERLADIVGAAPERIVFTGGATAANNALARHLATRATDGRPVALSAIEHPSVHEAFAAALPGRVVEIPVDDRGVVTLRAVEQFLGTTAPASVSVMAASNESGVLQPWEEVAGLCRERGIPFHTDAPQWLGKLPAAGLGACAWVTGSGHKFGGPKGVGFLVVPAGERGFHGERGGPQERGRWAGTENVAGIAAMVAALEARDAEAESLRETRAALRDGAARRLVAALPGARIVGDGAPRLWNTLAVFIPGIVAKKVVAALGRADVAASTGSACSAGADALPRVLAAVGAAPGGMVRLSGGWETTAADWDLAIDALVAAVSGGVPPAPMPRP